MTNCGCNSGGHADWNQAWRGPLRASLDWLRTFGCDCAQGYFFARPLDADALADFLRERAATAAPTPHRAALVSTHPALPDRILAA